jgi:hypothetical protein
MKRYFILISFFVIGIAIVGCTSQGGQEEDEKQLPDSTQMSLDSNRLTGDSLQLDGDSASLKQ